MNLFIYFIYHKVILSHLEVSKVRTSNLSSHFLMIIEKKWQSSFLCKYKTLSTSQATSATQGRPRILAAGKASRANEDPGPSEHHKANEVMHRLSLWKTLLLLTLKSQTYQFTACICRQMIAP